MLKRRGVGRPSSAPSQHRRRLGSNLRPRVDGAKVVPGGGSADQSDEASARPPPPRRR